jgi:hypothetical protein
MSKKQQKQQTNMTVTIIAGGGPSTMLSPDDFIKHLYYQTTQIKVLNTPVLDWQVRVTPQAPSVTTGFMKLLLDAPVWDAWIALRVRPTNTTPASITELDIHLLDCRLGHANFIYMIEHMKSTGQTYDLRLFPYAQRSEAEEWVREWARDEKAQKQRAMLAGGWTEIDLASTIINDFEMFVL